MTDLDPDVRRLLTEAADLPDGAVKVELIAEAVRIADARNDAATGFRARRYLMEAALTSGQPDVLTVAFSWCLAQSDRDPEAIPADEILWQYRWAVSDLPQFPQVPRGQIVDAIADMARRYQAAGSTLRSVHLLKMHVAIKLRDLALATEAQAEWGRVPRDPWSDSARTEQSFVASYLVFAKRYQDAIDQCPQALAGRPDDAHFFGRDSAKVLIPLLTLGRVADGMRVQRSGYRYIAKKMRYLDVVSCHIEFLARTNHFATAAKIFEEHVGLALETKMLLDRFDFFRVALILVERMRRAGATAIKFRLPGDFPVSPTGREYELTAMAEWFRADITPLGARFDARNANTYYADLLHVVDELFAAPSPAA
ncbi:hypothetical protein [Fimbriiglobus ruber]|uniref:Uncharacterized protein n=1 Tax=Fimbriiglobus ruber TaxID=1908690 RepID=A0A225EBC1_9BACT|nr:hypothetical protein [Fimbriiglobus ruber]OWK46669.1 hypothetical protein FRUB_00368 [Fimbriiglobus ruber]